MTLTVAAFADVDDATLHILSLWRDPRLARRRRSRSHHGPVTVRHEAPAGIMPASRSELLKATAENQRNWAWGKEDN